MIRHAHLAPKINSMRTLGLVAIVFAVGFTLQLMIVTPSASIEQVQARIEAVRSRPAPPVQPLPQVNPVEAREWTMRRDPFVPLATASAPSE